MDNQKSDSKRVVRVAQPEQIRHLFKGLRMLAGMLLIGAIILGVVLHFSSISRGTEFFLLLFYGVVAGGYLIARARSFLIAVRSVEWQAKEEMESPLQKE